jgi:hypothetical protein
MPDSRISALPSATSPLAGTEVLPIVQSGTTDKVTAADLLRQSGQTVTTSNPVLSLAQTWNAGGVTFTADLINVTDTASAATSRLFARQVGGADRFVILTSGAVTAYGNLTCSPDNSYDIGASGATRPRTVYAGTSFVAPDGSDASPGFTFGTSQTGIYRDSGGGRMRFAVAGNFAADLGANSFGVRSDTGTLTFGNSGDVILARDAAQTLAQRNGANAQTFRVYNTYTDASNYERGILAWESNALFVGTQAAGTGTVRDIFLRRGGTTYLCLGSTFGLWNINSSGHFVAGTDNTYDIGASGANRPRFVYAANNFVGGAGFVGASTGTLTYGARAVVSSPADGIVLLQNNALADFTRLQFGGTTSSFPALTRSGAGLVVQLADGSARGTLETGVFSSNSTVGAVGSVTASNATAIPAGGSNNSGFKFSSTANFGVFFGSGAPTLSAAKGSLYLRSDGSGTGDRMYVNTDGATAWTAVTTAT